MVKKREIVIGEMYGEWKVMGEVKGRSKVSVDALCTSCGVTHTRVLQDLVSGHSKRCAKCALSRRKETVKRTHGMSKTRFYKIWMGMRKRCDNPSHIEYPNYGGRGISYCESWKNFENFRDDMLSTYDDTLTLEREDVNGDYCKSNCSWVPMREQFENKRNSKMVTYRGETKSLPRWCRELDLPYGRTKRRLLKGFSPELAFTKDSLKHRNKDGTYGNSQSTNT